MFRNDVEYASIMHETTYYFGDLRLLSSQYALDVSGVHPILRLEGLASDFCSKQFLCLVRE